MKLSVIIIDDEPLAINVIKNYILQVKELTLAASFTNAVEASSYLQDHTADIIFLDINMPLLDGLEFLKGLHDLPMVVITTAHEEHALKGFELEAIDYLVKPIPFPRFHKAVQRILRLKQGTSGTAPIRQDGRPSIFVKVDNKKHQKIVLDDIVIIESLKDYIRIKTVNGKFIVHKTLGSITEELPSDKFMRIHRSYTVAFDRVEAIEGNSLECGGIRYTIGRSYLNEVKDRILNNSNSQAQN